MRRVLLCHPHGGYLWVKENSYTLKDKLAEGWMYCTHDHSSGIYPTTVGQGKIND